MGREEEEKTTKRKPWPTHP